MSALPPARRAVFLDRDGTIIEEAGYPDRLERLVLFPYTVDAVRTLNDGGFVVIVVSNQSGVARGIVPERLVAEAHANLGDRMRAGGARIDAYLSAQIACPKEDPLLCCLAWFDWPLSAALDIALLPITVPWALIRGTP